MGHMRSKLLLVMCFATGSVVSMISRISLPNDIAKWLPRAVELQFVNVNFGWFGVQLRHFAMLTTFIHPFCKSCGSYGPWLSWNWNFSLGIIQPALEVYPSTAGWWVGFGMRGCGEMISGEFQSLQNGPTKVYSTSRILRWMVVLCGLFDGHRCSRAACLFWCWKVEGYGFWDRVWEGEQGSGTLVEHGPRVRYSTIYIDL